MFRFFSLLAIFGTITAAVLVFALSRSVLPACGVIAQWFNATASYCPEQDVTRAETIDDLDQRRADLLARIADLEGRIAAQHCPVPVPQDEAVLDPDEPEQIDEERFAERDVTLLEGCWQLEQTLTVEDIQTGALTIFDDWQMCFDANGQGQQIMRSNNGIICEGGVPGQFDDGGQLLIAEPGNLQCSDGSFIYRRDISCGIGADGYLSCTARQPEINRQNDPFRMRPE
ncbi:hypothetical protein [Yoonia sp. SS1-5]|uniref:Uncharacterized protein n=1 Tax=Yoonia rhodophyticola TaxID=3137370 RepID=A0AAN0NLJ7_9RHOB